jgi:4-diphosphocytidyl-2-C-methyl-D-erythritol kinase
MGNTFESLVMPYVPLVQECAAIFRKYGLRPLMAGSGPTVFALVPPDKVAADIFTALQAQAAGMDTYMSSLVRGDYD